MPSSPQSTARPNINITPLIDVLLVLLIIFMVISPMRPHSFEAKIPDKLVTEPIVPICDGLLVVTIGLDRTLALNGIEFTPEQLSTTLVDVLAERADHTVFIKAPRQLSYSVVADVVDLIKGAGSSPIGLQVDFLE